MALSRTIRGIVIMTVMLTVLSGCTSANKSKSPTNTNPSTQKTTAAKEQPITPEKNPVGDIPDSQVFITYSSASGGYEIKVPEGWGRTTNGTDVTFVDKFDGVQLSVNKASSPPTVESVKSSQAADLEKTGKAVQINSIKEVNTSSGPAILIKYYSNSEADPVTAKKVRLENNSYIYYTNGKIAMLRLWAPLGADNVDQWKLMSDSFRWK